MKNYVERMQAGAFELEGVYVVRLKHAVNNATNADEEIAALKARLAEAKGLLEAIDQLRIVEYYDQTEFDEETVACLAKIKPFLSPAKPGCEHKGLRNLRKPGSECPDCGEVLP